jgi:hypothetical protein
MKFLLVHKLDESRPDAFNPGPELIAQMGEFVEETMKSGVLIAADGVLPSATGARLRNSGGTQTVIDGPFTEAKEVIAGYAVIKVDSKDDAIALASRFASIVGDTEVEIRQIAEWD